MIRILLVLLSTIGAVFADYSPREGCNADIIFILDESSSISGSNFTRQLHFVQDIIKDFDVDSGKVRIGVIKFSNEVEVPISLGKYTDEEQLTTEVGKIKQRIGNTKTELALIRLREEMSKSARRGVRHLAIVITDGDSDDKAETKKEADICHRENYEMFAVGVGRDVTLAQLKIIASDENLVFTVTSYAELQSSLREKLAWKACHSEPPPPPPPPPTLPPPICSQYVDLIWSISVRADAVEVNYALEFINSVIRELQTYLIDIQVGLTPKTCDGRDAILLKGYDTNAGFWRELEQSRLAAVRSDRVIEYIRLRGFSTQGGSRSEATKFGILIVDNTETDWENTVNEARLAKEEGIRLLVIGVGSRVDQEKLKELAWSENDYFYVSCYSQLSVIKIRITARFCIDTNQRVQRAWRKNLLESLYDF